jgi:hypothetical protein
MPTYGTFFTPKAINQAKIKPKQWGPLREVRMAMFRNAESLGIDSSKIVLYCPFWSENRPINLVDGNVSGNVGSAWVWSHTGAIHINNGATIFFDNVNIGGGTEVSCVQTASAYPSGSDYGRFFTFEDSAVSGFCINQYLDRTGINLFVETSGTNANSATDTGNPWHYINTTAGVCKIGETVKLYGSRGELLVNISGGTPTGIISNTNRVDFGDRPAGGRSSNCHFYSALIVKQALSVDIIQTFVEQPYLLLQRNLSPVIVDLGANTGLEKGFQLI